MGSVTFAGVGVSRATWCGGGRRAPTVRFGGRVGMKHPDVRRRAGTVRLPMPDDPAPVDGTANDAGAGALARPPLGYPLRWVPAST